MPPNENSQCIHLASSDHASAFLPTCVMRTPTAYNSLHSVRFGSLSDFRAVQKIHNFFFEINTRVLSHTLPSAEAKETTHCIGIVTAVYPSIHLSIAFTQRCVSRKL